MSQLYINDVLTANQKLVFLKLKHFKKDGIMAGGTALAFQLKHRKSYDFDIFIKKDISSQFRWKAKNIFGKKIKIAKESENELTFLTPKKVKITFFCYPFKPLYKIIKTPSISIFDWKEIAADKAYTIGRRPMYRDYIDVFFIIKNGHNLEKIISDAKKKFEGLFSEKLFLGQLVYLKDLRNFSIEFLRGKYTADEIKKYFEEIIKKYTKEKLKR